MRLRGLHVIASGEMPSSKVASLDGAWGFVFVRGGKRIGAGH